MALPSSGSIKFSQINVEILVPANSPISFGNTTVRTLAGVASGPVRLGANFWGKSFAFNVSYATAGNYAATSNGSQFTTTDNEKYNFDTLAVASATAVTGYWENNGASVSNRDVAILVTNTEATRKYTFATETTGAGGNLTHNMLNTPPFCLGTANAAYINGGGGASAASRKYTYATNTCVTLNSTAAGTNNRSHGASVGNTVKGAMIDGRGQNLTNRILVMTYASETSAHSTLTGYGGNNRTGNQGLSGPTYGLSTGGTDFVTNSPVKTAYKYTYSSNAVAVGAVYTTTARGGIAGSGNSLVGLVTGGSTFTSGPVYTYYKTRDIYTFSSETFSTTTQLNLARAYAWSYSGNPGYL